jgi:hypothetical protein
MGRSPWFLENRSTAASNRTAKHEESEQREQRVTAATMHPAKKDSKRAFFLDWKMCIWKEEGENSGENSFPFSQ